MVQQPRKDLRYQAADPDARPWHVYLDDGVEWQFWRKFATKPEALQAELPYVRQCRRVQVNIDPTHWGLTEQCLEDGRITSLSAGGCFLATAAQLVPGQIVYLRFALPRKAGQAGVPRTLEAQVRYHFPPAVGVGLQFVNLTEADERNLARYVADAVRQLRAARKGEQEQRQSSASA
jgi:PilZ domain